MNKYGCVPEWPNGADCKSAVFRLRWFESIRTHAYAKARATTGKALVVALRLALRFPQSKQPTAWFTLRAPSSKEVKESGESLAEIAQSIEH